MNRRCPQEADRLARRAVAAQQRGRCGIVGVVQRIAFDVDANLDQVMSVDARRKAAEFEPFTVPRLLIETVSFSSWWPCR